MELFFVRLHGVAQFGAFRDRLFARFTGLFFSFLLRFFVFAAAFLELFERSFTTRIFEVRYQFVRLFGGRLARVEKRPFAARAAAQRPSAERREQERGEAAGAAHGSVSACGPQCLSVHPVARTCGGGRTLEGC
ncbi:MAG: hypothetical protein ACYDC2_06880 [Solirubrobacteraceae bacterium]